MKLPLEVLTAVNFAPFGRVLELSPDGDPRFQVLVTEPDAPWRLAIFQYQNHTVEALEAHPTTLETFEPLSGCSVLLVAEHEHPEKLHAFLLDKPVCLYKSVWHQTLALSQSAQVRITENLDVPGTVFYHLPTPIGLWIAE